MEVPQKSPTLRWVAMGIFMIYFCSFSSIFILILYYLFILSINDGEIKIKKKNQAFKCSQKSRLACLHGALSQKDFKICLLTESSWPFQHLQGLPGSVPYEPLISHTFRPLGLVRVINCAISITNLGRFGVCIRMLKKCPEPDFLNKR